MTLHTMTRQEDKILRWRVRLLVLWYKSIPFSDTRERHNRRMRPFVGMGTKGQSVSTGVGMISKGKVDANRCESCFAVMGLEQKEYNCRQVRLWASNRKNTTVDR